MRVGLPPGADVMHWTYPLPLWAKDRRNIYTFHDLIPLRLPFTTLDQKHQYYRLCRYLVRNADHIVTVSETSRRDIISLLGVQENKVTNTYQSVEIPETYLKVPVDVLKDELLGTFRLEYKKYLLYYGALEPKKNIGRIIEAYLAANLDIPLVIVGAQEWRSKEELKLLVDDNIRSMIQIGPETLVRRKVVRLEYATFPQLVNLIRGATAVTFPSLYEGFGLPVIESMICETPVITANAHSTLEISGDAAVLVDPYNTREIKDAIQAIVANEGLRAEKIDKGRTVVKRFSAEAYRTRLGELYAKVRRDSRDTAGTTPAPTSLVKSKV
jgi:glycosyltransferase involved in cell wall biosynthesis